jgi:hypothetical protein
VTRAGKKPAELQSDSGLLRNAETSPQTTRRHIPEYGDLKFRGSVRARGPEVTKQ